MEWQRLKIDLVRHCSHDMWELMTETLVLSARERRLLKVWTSQASLQTTGQQYVEEVLRSKWMNGKACSASSCQVADMTSSQLQCGQRRPWLVARTSTQFGFHSKPLQSPGIS